jgi:hypothetical protein
VAKDPRITKVLNQATLQRTFDLQRQLRYVEAIFARVFTDNKTPSATGPHSSSGV